MSSRRFRACDYLLINFFFVSRMLITKDRQTCTVTILFSTTWLLTQESLFCFQNAKHKRIPRKPRTVTALFSNTWLLAEGYLFVSWTLITMEYPEKNCTVSVLVSETRLLAQKSLFVPRMLIKKLEGAWENVYKTIFGLKLFSN